MLTTNRNANPLKYDPSGTATIRKAFTRELEKRFTEFKRKVRTLIVDEDAFGLKPYPLLSFNAAAENVFCPTGEGGGIDPTCKPGGASWDGMSKSDRIEKLFAITDPISVADAVAKISGKTEKDGGVDPAVHFRETSFTHRIGNIPLEYIRKNESGDLYDDTTRRDVASDYATRKTDAPPIYVVMGRKGDVNVIDGGHRLTAARMRGDSTILAIIGFKPSDIVENTVHNVRELAELTDEQKLEAFRLWLIANIGDGIVTVSPKGAGDWWYRYIAESYEKSYGRAYDQVVGKKTLSTMARDAYIKRYGQVGSVSDFYAGSKEEFLRSAFGGPVPIERVKFLASRTYTDLKGVTDAMSNQMSRVLVDGLIAGDNPRVIAKKLIDRVDKIGVTRAKAVAHNSIISAHAEGTLDSLESLGMDQVGIALEWSTSGLGMTARGNPSPCFPAGTLVESLHGPIPIENVTVGMMVHTRKGPRSVLAVSCRNYDGPLTIIKAGSQSIVATPEHPVWVNGVGWSLACDVQVGEMMKSFTNESVEVRAVTDFSLGDANNMPSHMDEILCFSSVPVSVSVPVRAIDLKCNFKVGNNEVDRVSSYLSFLNECYLKSSKAESDCFFDGSLGVGSPIARKRAEPSSCSGRNFPEFGSACVAFLQNNWPATNLGAIPLIPVFVATDIEWSAASRTRNDSRSTLEHLTIHRAVVMVMGHRLLYGEFLGTSGADLCDATVSAKIVVALLRAKFAGFYDCTPCSVAQLSALRARDEFSSFIGLSVAPMSAVRLGTSGGHLEVVSPKFDSTMVALKEESRPSRLLPGLREAGVGTKPLSGFYSHRLRSSLECGTTLRACELKWHEGFLDSVESVRKSIMSCTPFQVYNIEVADENEYFANGLLVHNCEICKPMNGVVFSIKEARGLIPHHSFCRCSWLSVRSDSDAIRPEQIRDASGIRKAIKESIKAERPKKTKRTIAEQREASSWAGARVKVAKKRPKGVY